MSKYNKTIKISCLVLLIFIIIICTVVVLNRSANFSESKNELEGTITFISNRTDKREELNSLIEEFEKIHPKVQVNLDLKGDFEEILERKASVGELPDVTLVPTVISTNEYKDYFIPLDDLGFNEDNIYSYSVGVGDDEKLYSLSTSIAWPGIIYNKKIFKDANIQHIPKTIDEFFDACNKIKTIGKTPITLNYKQSWAMSIWVDTVPYLLDQDIENKIVINSNDVLGSESGIYKSLEFARNIVKKGYCEDDLLNYDWEQCKNDIKDGKIAMINCSSDLIYQLEDMGMNKEDIGIFPIPESKFINIAGNFRFGISKNTKNPEIAKDFMKFMYEEDRYAKAVNIMSTLKNNENNMKMIESLKEFNLPIIIEGDMMKNQTDEERRIHDKYNNNRKITGLNSKYVQKYVIAPDVKEIREESNKEWKNLR
ncbi:extracellular solute-binding protein [Clostridium sp. SHJSY1]|uniref:ABC transporter substrate-binding protein n=1 Tax=Clostridium sp. SHJSY1 TaxID=2942483 RepID=UPI002876D85F|nr:extracellular solute-binding protein [Clostridium sp. SHJSY1]MDS0524826.1 extracellular solute-binding protein [Clostridium sp. SHJSY1]